MRPSSGADLAARLSAKNVDLWPMTDRARFVGSAADLTEYLAELAAHVDGVLFFTRPTSPDVSPASTSSPAAGPAGTS
jgi:hypothetical protein